LKEAESRPLVGSKIAILQLQEFRKTLVFIYVVIVSDDAFTVDSALFRALGHSGCKLLDGSGFIRHGGCY